MKKLIFLLICSIFILSLVSAGQFDLYATRTPIYINATWNYNINETSTRVVIPSVTSYRNYSDLRFVDVNNNTINYWFENNTVGSNLVVWLKTSELNASANQTIYMYSGNRYVSTNLSNISSVFMFADDFEGTSVNYNKWATADKTKFTIVRNELLMNSTQSAPNGLFSNVNFTSNYSVIGRFINRDNTDGLYISSNTQNNASFNGIVDVVWVTTGTTRLISNSISVLSTYNVSKYYIFQIDNNGTNSSTIYYNDTFDSIAAYNRATKARQNGFVSLLKYSTDYCVNCNSSIDWIFVKKMTPQEPSITFGDTIALPQYAVNNVSYNLNSLETNTEYFNLNLSYDDAVYDFTVAYLVYNGTEYLAQTQNTFTNGIVVNRTISVPLGTGNKSFYWKVGLTNSSGLFYFNSSTYNQSISTAQFIFGLCNTTLTSKYLNITFHNETTAREAVKAAISESTFTYSLSSDFNVYKTYTFANATENYNYSFCFSPNFTTVYVRSSISYYNSYSQQRTYTNNSMILSNSTYVQDLLLLPDTNGIYISMIIQNQKQQRIDSALIDIKKTSNGAAVEQKYTDGTGIAAFWLSTGTAYTVTITKSGYETFTTSITPSTSPVTYTMTSTASDTGYTPSENIIINIQPATTKLENDTTYSFVYKISASRRTLDEYGFALYNTTDMISTQRVGFTSSGSTLSLSFDTANYSYITMRYYYIIDGNYTNGTAQWYVVNTAGTDNSIAHFFDDMLGFMGENSTGIWGVKKGTTSGDFTLAIVIFLITLFLGGVMTYKYGVSGSTGTLFVIFSVVTFFDIATGLMPNIIGIPHFISILLGVITLGAFIREVAL